MTPVTTAHQASLPSTIFHFSWTHISSPHLLLAEPRECNTWRASSFRIWNSSTGTEYLYILFYVIIPCVYILHSMCKNLLKVLTELIFESLNLSPSLCDSQLFPIYWELYYFFTKSPVSWDIPKSQVKEGSWLPYYESSQAGQLMKNTSSKITYPETLLDM